MLRTRLTIVSLFLILSVAMYGGWVVWPVVAGSIVQTSRVSVATAGTQGDNASQAPAISGDGRYVAFASEASNLVPGDTNGGLDVFIHDRQTNQTSRVSVASGGTQGNGISFGQAISADGRYVAFTSDATNLVPSDTSGVRDIFVHDRQTNQTSRVSVASGGMQANNSSVFPTISADGRYVAFASAATNLILDDTNGDVDIFVHDRQTGQTSRVSVATGGTQGNGTSFDQAISADGRYVAFASEASNLVPGDTNGGMDVFVHDRQTGQTSRVSVASGGMQANNASMYLAISGDGRYVAFHSEASNLVPGDTNGGADIFVHDRWANQTSRVSIATGGTQGDGQSQFSAISGDGRSVAFMSEATNLVSGDTNGVWDIFVHDQDLPPPSGTARLTGRVADAADTPLAGVFVAAYRLDNLWNFAGGALTTPAGDYTIENLPAGTYRVRFTDLAGVYQPEYYDSQSTFGAAADLAVTDNETTAGVDAVLETIPPPPIYIGSGCGQVAINEMTGDVTLRFPRDCQDTVELVAPVVCSNGSAPADVTFFVNNTAFPMTPTGEGDEYKVSLTLSNNFPGDGDSFRVTAQCGNQVETIVEGDVERYDPNGLIIDAETGQPIKGAVVNLYRVPDKFPDTSTETRDCRTSETRPQSDGGPFGPWSGLSGTTLAINEWVNPTLALINNTPAVISPTVNPQITGFDGAYGWEMDEGCWYIEARAEGYHTLVSPLVGVRPAVADLNMALESRTAGVYLPAIIK